MFKCLVKRISIGFIIGSMLLPSLVATCGLYLPLLFNIDPIFGDLDVNSIIKEGYILTKDDVSEFKHLSSTLTQFGWIGIYLGLAGAAIGCFGAYIDKKSDDSGAENR